METKRLKNWEIEAIEDLIPLVEKTYQINLPAEKLNNTRGHCDNIMRKLWLDSKIELRNLKL
jgi:hypothetical protein